MGFTPPLADVAHQFQALDDRNRLAHRERSEDTVIDDNVQVPGRIDPERPLQALGRVVPDEDLAWGGKAAGRW